MTDRIDRAPPLASLWLAWLLGLTNNREARRRWREGRALSA